jgi:hypothetical protein
VLTVRIGSGGIIEVPLDPVHFGEIVGNGIGLSSAGVLRIETSLFWPKSQILESPLHGFRGIVTGSFMSGRQASMDDSGSGKSHCSPLSMGLSSLES